MSITPTLLTICILLSIVLPLINWGLSFIQVPSSYAILKFFEVLLTVAIGLTITITLINYHLVLNREQFSFIAYVPFLLCVFAVQIYYAQQYYKISYIFITNFVTLLLTLILLFLLPSKILSLPIFIYYLVHVFILLVWDLREKNHDNIMTLIKKQTWINDSKLLNTILPIKNINTYILPCVASFCYSSLNLCILVSFKEKGIPEYTALCFTCVLLILTAIISFSLLVKYDDVGNEPFPGCLLIHYITQAYKRCENIIYSEQNKSYTKFTFKSVIFAILLIVDALGSTSYAMTAQIVEQHEIAQEQPLPVAESRYSAFGDTLRRTFSLPNLRSTAGSFGTGVASAYAYDQIFSNPTPQEDPQVIIARLEEQVKAKDDLLFEKDKQIQLLEENNKLKEAETNKASFFKSLFTCFKIN